MTDKTILDEVRGTITEVYEYPVLKGETITSMLKGIIIQLDDETKGTISGTFIGGDYSQFSVGQRVVRVIRKNPVDEEKVEHVIYDELSYDEKMQSAKIR